MSLLTPFVGHITPTSGGQNASATSSAGVTQSAGVAHTSVLEKIWSFKWSLLALAQRVTNSKARATTSNGNLRLNNDYGEGRCGLKLSSQMATSFCWRLGLMLRRSWQLISSPIQWNITFSTLSTSSPTFRRNYGSISRCDLNRLHLVCKWRWRIDWFPSKWLKRPRLSIVFVSWMVLLNSWRILGWPSITTNWLGLLMRYLHISWALGKAHLEQSFTTCSICPWNILDTLRLKKPVVHSTTRRNFLLHFSSNNTYNLLVLIWNQLQILYSINLLVPTHVGKVVVVVVEVERVKRSRATAITMAKEDIGGMNLWLSTSKGKKWRTWNASMKR